MIYLSGMLIHGFDPREFVPPSIYNQFGAEKSWWFVDMRLPLICKQIKDDFGGAAVIINNWHFGGVSQNSGYRTPTSTVGASLSQHRRGCAADVKVKGYTAKQVYDLILANKDKYMALGLTTLEDIADTPTWTHLDTRYTGSNEILIVKP